jgi:hypothetical protein
MDFKKLLEAMDEFAGEKAGQKPGDQVRGTDKAASNKGRHPFLKRLVGELKQPKSTHKYEQELSEAWLEFKEAAPAPVPGQPAAAPGAVAAPPAGAAPAPATPPKPGQPAPIDPKAAADLKKNLTSLKTVLPDLDVTKATTTMAKADIDAKLGPGDQAVVGKIAPELANVIKNQPVQLKQLIDKSNKVDAAASKTAGTTTPATPTAPAPPGAPVPPGTQPK